MWIACVHASEGLKGKKNGKIASLTMWELGPTSSLAERRRLECRSGQRPSDLKNIGKSLATGEM